MTVPGRRIYVNICKQVFIYSFRAKAGKGGQTMYETIRELLINEMNLDESQIRPDATLTGDLGLNSLELADLIVMCEERFGVVFEDDDLASLQTIPDVADYIEERQ